MKKILSYIIIIGLFLVAGMKTAAIESRYKNNLLNVELSQTPDNRVSVLLVFEKPYTEPVKVVYKTDNEYNILLPETYHSVTSVSTLNALNIRNASVKLVPYFNQDNSNGYTKIVLQTTRPVVFNAHASYITTQIAQNDLIDKIEQDDAFKINPTTVKVASVPVKKQAKAGSTKSQVKTVAAKPVVKTTSKPVQKPASKSQQVKTVSKPVSVAQTKTQHDTDNLVKQTQTQGATSVIEEKIVQQVEPVKVDPVKAVVNNYDEKMDVKVSSSNSFDLSKLIEREKLPLFVMIFAALLLALLLRRIIKQRVKSQSISMPQSKYEFVPETQDIPQEFKDLSWQEKYKFMKEKEEQNNHQVGTEEQLQRVDMDYAQGDVELNNSHEFEPEKVVQKVGLEEISEINEKVIESLNEKAFNQEVEQDLFGLNNPPINEGFELNNQSQDEDIVLDENDLETLNDISDIEPSVDLLYEDAPDKEEIEEVSVDVEINETIATNPLEPTLINQAKISKTKGFYLVRYENEVALMGYINEQIFLLHSFDNKQPAFIQTRLTEKKKGSEVYMVRAENFKSLIKVTKDNMQTLINL